MTIDFRAELQALVNAYNEHGGRWPQHHEDALADAVDRARAALAEQPVGLTDEELNALWNEQYGYTGSARMMNLFEFRDGARAVLARWGKS